MAVEIEDAEYTQFLKTLGNRIKQLRKERGYSLRDMVIHHGYNDSQWRRYERGGAINVHSLMKIAKLFEMSLSTLLDGLAEYPQASIQDIKKQRAPTSAATKGKKKTKQDR